ncbi:hypothetical protein J4416_04170 [Candidatus Pacearchaeota archaeon]|nr:hypothetical protein [Candidatus Pacearchaeota archaeon]
MKRRVMFLIGCFILLIGLSGFVLADHEEGHIGDEEIFDRDLNNIDESIGVDGEISDEFGDAQLERGAGITPDSGFYFVEDSILSKFRSDSDNREKKIAELREMIKEGDVDSARKALEKYREYADMLEREIDPEKRDEARRSASAVRNAIRGIENEIPEEDRKEFVDDIVDRERKIVTAVEIAGKIRDLCKQLSGLDPNEYARVCSTGDDSPNWQKKLDKDLTSEQRDEARKFGGIMSQCFETAGQQCRCEEIPYPEFANACSVAAPLATACEVDGDEDACEALDGLEMPELPDHLQDIFESLEGDISKAQFDLHMPRECRDAGATSPKKCMKIMIETNAPEECRDELISRNIQNEREAREICEKIMFELNAPEECVSAGLKDPRECGKLMFKENAPQECIDAGLTGENRNDHKKCEEIMRDTGDRKGPSRGFGGNCREIQNSEERLKCYDGAVSGVGEFRGDFERRFTENNEKQTQCANQCKAEGKAWDFSGGNCVCREGQRFEERREFDDRGEFNVLLECQGLSPEECREKFNGEGFENNYESPPRPGDANYEDNTAKYDCSNLDCGPSPNYCNPWQGCIKGDDGFNPDGSSCDEGYEWDSSKKGCIPFGTGDYGFDNSGSSEPDPSSETQEESSGSGSEGSFSEGESSGSGSEGSFSEGSGGITGGVIVDVSKGNGFLSYYFR